MTSSGKWVVLFVTGLAAVAAVGIRFRTPSPIQATADDAESATLMEFGSTRCTACKAMHAELAKLREECPNEPAVVEVDVFEEGETASRHGVTIIPTQVFFDGSGKEVGRHEGFLARADILARFAPHGAACR